MNAVRCGVIGHPVAHSRSPEIHRAFAEQAGISLDYQSIDAAPETFATRVHYFFTAGGRGLNVTLPHKAAAFELADEAGEEARRSGVANVLTRLDGGQIRADNSDGIGLVRDLSHSLDFTFANSHILIVGAGGAAAGIVPALLDAGVSELRIINRTAPRAETLVSRLNEQRLAALSAGELANAGSFDLVVNATSTSLEGSRPALPDSVIGPGALTYDLVYAEEATPFMAWASTLGATVADGWGMLVEQAAESFRLWHGVHPDTAPLLRRRHA